MAYNSVLVVELSCARCIDHLHTDLWILGGKPRKQYIVEFDPDSNYSVPEDVNTDTFTVVQVCTC